MGKIIPTLFMCICIVSYLNKGKLSSCLKTLTHILNIAMCSSPMRYANYSPSVGIAFLQQASVLQSWLQSLPSRLDWHLFSKLWTIHKVSKISIKPRLEGFTDEIAGLLHTEEVPSGHLESNLHMAQDLKISLSKVYFLTPFIHGYA